MKLNAAAIRRTLLTLTAAAAPLLPLLVDHHVLSATDATSVGAVLAALTGAWHGAAYVTQAESATVTDGTVGAMPALQRAVDQYVASKADDAYRAGIQHAHDLIARTAPQPANAPSTPTNKGTSTS